MDTVADIGRWLAELDPTFAFLLALPFAVAVAGLLSEWLRSRGRRRAPRVARMRRGGGRIAQLR